MYLATEFMKAGSLDKILHNREEWPDSMLTPYVRWRFCHDIAMGMHYLHLHQPMPILHRDLRSPNILVDEDLRAKVADFGLARVREEGASFSATPMVPVAWSAPEYINDERFFKASDVYSYGVVVWEVHSRQWPYKGKPIGQIVKEVSNGKRLLIPDNCPKELADLIQLTWAHDPTKRPDFSTISDVLERLKPTTSDSVCSKK